MAGKYKWELVYEFVSTKIGELSNESPRSRAALAKLRRGAGKSISDSSETWDIVFEDFDDALKGPGNNASDAENVVHTALTLYAIHQQGKDQKMSGDNSFGNAVKKLISADGSNENAVKRRFDAVITADNFREFSHHARGLVQLMKANNVPLDYPGFAKDLYLYCNPEHKNNIRLRWGRDFYMRKKPVTGQKEEKAHE
jgi:CRISPR system Cascade subunit CasB